MKLIVGLGNPGKKYQSSRHNVGFKVIEKLGILHDCKWKFEKKYESDVCDLKRDGLMLIKPTTFMNDSGRSVSSALSFYKIDSNDLFVVHDDLDIELGRYKIQKAKGPKDHGGLNSIYQLLGTNDFWHVRIGVDNRKSFSEMENGEGKIPGEEYVLKGFSKVEQKTIEKTIKEVIEDLKTNYL